MKDCLEKITQRVDEVLTLLAVERERADRLQDELHEAHTLCQMQKNSEEGYARAVAMTQQELEIERAENSALRVRLGLAIELLTEGTGQSDGPEDAMDWALRIEEFIRNPDAPAKPKGTAIKEVISQVNRRRDGRMIH